MPTSGWAWSNRFANRAAQCTARRVVRVWCASQFAGEVAPTSEPTSTRSAWDSSRIFTCATCAASRFTSTSASPVSEADIDHTGVPATDPSSRRTDATTVATGWVGSSAAAVMTPTQPTLTDRTGRPRGALWKRMHEASLWMVCDSSTTGRQADHSAS